MSHTLKVTIRNFCLFILTDTGAEGWIISDPSRHTPYLDLDAASMDLPLALQGTSRVDLTGCVVAFGTGDPTAGGTELAQAETTSGGSYWDRLLHLNQIATGVQLRKNYKLGRSEKLESGLDTRIMLNGGVLIPEVRTGKPGDQKEFTIGAKLEQYLISQSSFYVETPDVPFVTIEKGGKKTNIPLVQNGGLYSVRLGATEITTNPALQLHHGVAFVTEVAALEQAVTLPAGASLPIPHCYWPEYGNETDPDGGPCVQAILEQRTFESILAAFRVIVAPNK